MSPFTAAQVTRLKRDFLPSKADQIIKYNLKTRKKNPLWSALVTCFPKLRDVNCFTRTTKTITLYNKLYWQSSSSESRRKQLCRLELADEAFQVVPETQWQISLGKIQMSAPTVNLSSMQPTLDTQDIESVSATNSKSSAQDPKGSVVMLSQKLCDNKDPIQ